MWATTRPRTFGELAAWAWIQSECVTRTAYTGILNRSAAMDCPHCEISSLPEILALLENNKEP